VLKKGLTEPTLLEMSGRRVYQELVVGTRLISLTCAGDKFSVSRAAEAYDAQARGLNEKFGLKKR
jgi:hypothetical protein